MGWDRKELKKAGKEALKDNYWKSVFVSFLMLVLTGTTTAAITMNGSADTSNLIQSVLQSNLSGGQPIDERIWIIFGIVLSGMLFLLMVFRVLIIFFLKNPLEIGVAKFMLKTATARQYEFKHQGRILELGFAFDNNYMGMIKVMFFRDLYTVLWSLLLLVPGVIKHYEYRLVPYIVCEHPDYTAEQTLKLSSQMMKGEKWKVFMLDLSFIGWHILGLITLGIVEALYVSPYVNVTNANLYRAVRKDYTKRLDQNV